MEDFAILGLAPRPWLDPAVVRQAFQERARTRHPDAAEGDAQAFARLNAACGLVTAPASRLRLLAGDAPIPNAPPDIELGFAIGAFARAGGVLLARHGAAQGPLARALLAGELAVARRRLDELSAEVARAGDAATTQLCALDARWPDVPAAELAALAGAFTFLDRWTRQLRELGVELAVAGA